jgi:tetratricopeptide (TPR) repeat protein
MAKASWAKFPHPEKAYAYDGANLKKHWDRLHRGDCEPFPKDEAIQEAWRLHHQGDFGRAVEAGLAAGVDGYNVANKAQAIYATYLEKAGPKKAKLFQEAMERGEEAMQARPRDANAHYFFAMAAGRYGQEISIAKALAQGLGGKIKEALDKAIKLQAKHADAHIALGTWHAEIIGKVGAMVGKLTYGASRDAAVEHFGKALKLNPDSAIARIEYANGLVLLFGKDRMKEAEKLYAEAAKQKPMDAMERLDVELAKSELED